MRRKLEEDVARLAGDESVASATPRGVARRDASRRGGATERMRPRWARARIGRRRVTRRGGRSRRGRTAPGKGSSRRASSGPRADIVGRDPGDRVQDAPGTAFALRAAPSCGRVAERLGNCVSGRRGGVVTQGTANPRTRVRFPASPPAPGRSPTRPSRPAAPRGSKPLRAAPLSLGGTPFCVIDRVRQVVPPSTETGAAREKGGRQGEGRPWALAGSTRRATRR